MQSVTYDFLKWLTSKEHGTKIYYADHMMVDLDLLEKTVKH